MQPQTPRRGTMINPRASLAGVDAVNGQCWYEIRALAAGRVEVYIYDVIGAWGVSAQRFASDCREVGVFEAAAIDLHIHSPGGDVMDGFAIYNTLARLTAKVDIWIDGVAASMASMIACLPGATVHMPENAWMMIHKPWGGVAGDSDDMREYADWLDRNESLMLNAYMQKTGLSQEALEAMLKAETWMNGAEALANGFADVLEPELQAAACINENKLKDFGNMPQEIKNLFTPRAHTAQNRPQPKGENGTEPSIQGEHQNPGQASQQQAQQPLMGNIDISALAAQLQQNMQQANAQRVADVSAVFEQFPAFASLKAECIADMSCNAEQARSKLLSALAAGTTPSAGPGAVHLHAGNGNIVGDSVRAAVMSRAGYAEAQADNPYNGYPVHCVSGLPVEWYGARDH
ncbi:Clp protease ClpP [Enterobacteriaceae bacterium BIT-l23]|uniref:head maturation protease, ClpP-related n=1 Tax=Jejubacter sp. L23 TaxID=3092086 RepID=UPI001585C6A2|nr:Clp protease ClpP [Enterobacteriaceae bacterium BIT-l23]